MTTRRQRSALAACLPILLMAACGLLLSVSGAAAAVQPGHGFNFPHDASLNGYRIDRLIEITMWFVALLFVIMCGWMALAFILHGRKHVAHYEHGDGKTSVAVAVIISSVIFFVVDGNLFVTSMNDLSKAFWNYSEVEKDPKALRVEVNARQWAWDFRLAGPDGKFGTVDDIVTLNDLRVPKDRPILVQIGATDVIHAFYLPNMRQKMDAVPGTLNHMWFQAKETGEFDIACAQHCGPNHYLMAGKLTVLDGPDFDAWAPAASKLSSLNFDENDASSHWGWAWKEQ